MNNRIIRNIP